MPEWSYHTVQAKSSMFHNYTKKSYEKKCKQRSFSENMFCCRIPESLFRKGGQLVLFSCSVLLRCNQSEQSVISIIIPHNAFLEVFSDPFHVWSKAEFEAFLPRSVKNRSQGTKRATLIIKLSQCSSE